MRCFEKRMILMFLCDEFEYKDKFKFLFDEDIRVKNRLGIFFEKYIELN